MAVTPRLELRQTQSLVMTPQLQQAIKLLQLSNLEVTQYIEQELEQNPLLERAEPGQTAEEGGEATASEQASEDARAEPEGAAAIVDPIEPANGAAAKEAPLDTDFANVWASEPADPAASFERWGRGGGSDFDDEGGGQMQAREASLREHLLSQLNIDIPDPVDRIIGAHLIEMLDDSGYLTTDLGQIADILQCDVPRVEAALARMQRLDPPGVFARSLKECLALQLRERDRLDPAMERLLGHLDLLARRDVASLRDLCGVSGEDLADMIVEIRALDPKPGLAFDSVVAHPIVPDVLMRPVPGGGWLVELNQESLPRVLVNSQYHAIVAAGTRSRDEKAYVAERMQAANWLVKSLHQRAQTILKVATEIVRQQEAFFRHGVRHLKPLVLRDIAEAIEMHESTVSRVTTNKYLAAPQGMYELKYFFTTAIANSAGGDAHSAEAVRSHIKSLIDSENEGGVLSDDQLVDALKREGINIARRTVAKYREAMRIPSSVRRRREKSLGL